MKLFDYNSNLETARLMLESGIKNAVTPVEEQEVYLNAYNIISDFINELAGSPLSLGQRISTLYNIVNSKVTQKILSYISRNRRSATFKNISSNNSNTSFMVCCWKMERLDDRYFIYDR